MTTILKIRKITENAFAPTKGSTHAAGLDLYSAYDYLIRKRSNIVAFTDLSVHIPDGCYGRVAPRSGLAVKHAIDVGAGVIDRDYRGNVGVILFNHADKDFKIRRGDRVAQLILEKYVQVDSVVEEEEEEDEENVPSERGTKGFGSTGGFS